jgi:hypothetical protein
MSAAPTGVLARLRQPVGPRSRLHQRVGGSPQVSLLPVEVRAAGALAVHQRKLVALVVVAMIAAAGAVFVAQQNADVAQQRLATVQAQAQALGNQLGKFKDVRTLESQIALGKAAVQVGSSTLIDWRTQIDAIEAAMPSSYTLTEISANGATPFAIYPQGSNLLEPTRVATITMHVTAHSFGEEFSSWIRDLHDVPAYADATANTSIDASTGLTTIILTVHLTQKAFSAGKWTGFAR